MWSEIYGDAVELEISLRAAVHATGWLDGAAETPHHLTLRARTRGKVASFEIDQAPAPIVDAMRKGSRNIGYRHNDWLEEWRDGVQTIRLAGAMTGEFRGRYWSDILEDAVPALPADVLAPLREFRPDEFANRLLDHLYGPVAAPGPSIVFHAPYKRVDDQVLVEFFETCRSIAAERGELTIPGIARLVCRRLRDQAGTVMTASPEDVLKDWANGGALAVDLSPMASQLPACDLDAVAAHLARALALHSSGQDLLFGSRLALHLREYPAYEGRNPRTGQSVRVPGKRLPCFVFADPYSDK